MSESKLPPSVQFFDCLPEIKSMKSRRFSVRYIWTHLKSQGKYMGDYTHFCRLHNKEFDEKRRAQEIGEDQKKTNTVSQKNQAVNSIQDQDEPLMFMADIGHHAKQ